MDLISGSFWLTAIIFFYVELFVLITGSINLSINLKPLLIIPLSFFVGFTLFGLIYKKFNNPTIVRLNLLFEEILYAPITLGKILIQSEKDIMINKNSQIKFVGWFFKYKILLSGECKNKIDTFNFKIIKPNPLSYLLPVQELSVDFNHSTYGKVTLQYKGFLLKTNKYSEVIKNSK